MLLWSYVGDITADNGLGLLSKYDEARAFQSASVDITAVTHSAAIYGQFRSSSPIIAR